MDKNLYTLLVTYRETIWSSKGDSTITPLENGDRKMRVEHYMNSTIYST